MFFDKFVVKKCNFSINILSFCPPVGRDSLFPPQCFPMHPAAMGPSAGFCYSLWNADAEAVQVSTHKIFLEPLS